MLKLLLLFVFMTLALGSDLSNVLTSTIQRKLKIPFAATSLWQQNESEDNFGKDIPVYFTDLRNGLPTCDPLSSYKDRPYSGYRFSYEIRIPYHLFTEKDETGEPKLDINTLNYANLVRSDYPKYFVMSTCDNNFVKGEITVPVATIGQDIWNLTFCSDYIPTDNLVPTDGASPPMIRLKYNPAELKRLYHQSRLANFTPGSKTFNDDNFDAHSQQEVAEMLIPHPFYDMFLNRRLKLADPHEPDVRSQYCFHVAKARMFKNHQLFNQNNLSKNNHTSKLDLSSLEIQNLVQNMTPEWGDPALRQKNFVGAMYQCVDNKESAALGSRKISSRRVWKNQHVTTNNIESEFYDEYGLTCTRENMKPIMPLLRDSTVSLWAVLVPKLENNSGKASQLAKHDNQHDENGGLNKREFNSISKSFIKHSGRGENRQDDSTVSANDNTKSRPIARIQDIIKNVRKDSKTRKDIDNVENDNLEFVVRIPWLYTPDVFDTGYPSLIITNGGYFYHDKDLSKAHSFSLKKQEKKSATDYRFQNFGKHWGMSQNEGIAKDVKNVVMPNDELKELVVKESQWQATRNKELELGSENSDLTKWERMKRMKRNYWFFSKSRTHMWHKWIKSVDPLEEYVED